jgi:hypothetical protein
VSSGWARACAAAFVSKHHWLIIACDRYGTVIDLDLTVKRRDRNAPTALHLMTFGARAVNGHGRTRIAAMSRYPSILDPDGPDFFHVFHAERPHRLPRRLSPVHEHYENHTGIPSVEFRTPLAAVSFAS